MSFDTTERILQELKELAHAMASSTFSNGSSPRSTDPSSNENTGVVRQPSLRQDVVLAANHKDPNLVDGPREAGGIQKSQAASTSLSSSQHAPLDRSDIMSGSHTPPTPQDMDGSTFDGVKTLVLFLHSDQERFEQVARSMWAPEDVEVPTEDASDEEDSATWLRLPAFPFGGGVTDIQEQYLFHKYCEVRHASSPSRSPAASQVEKITVEAFRARVYNEALEGSAVKTWKPQSVTDFVVEVEPEIMFDAHTAKAARRLQLCEEASKGGKGLMASTINLRVIMDPLRTGFEEEKEYAIEPGRIVAERYQIVDLLGKATFSRAVRAYDLHQEVHDDDGNTVGYMEVCLKIINNTKEFFDQSLDEIRLLQYINTHANPDDTHVIQLIDYFYYKEHTFLVTELLSDNLYEYAKYNREHEAGTYFTLPRLHSIATQVLKALAYIHSLKLMHCDLKPENILFVSHRRCIIKVIDFGSSCFLSDHLSSYIQSRSYRAPEVILGADYDGRIDIWSLGAILAELVTGDVLFSSETVPEMLARIVAVCGKPLPRSMIWEGRHAHDFINKFGCIYEVGNKERDENAEDSYYLYNPMPLLFGEEGPLNDKQLPYAMLRAKLASCGMVDPLFVDFLQQCLTLDHKLRPTAEELLKHPFITTSFDEASRDAGGNDVPSDEKTNHSDWDDDEESSVASES